MAAYRIRLGFFSNQTMNCQAVVFLLKKIHSSIFICNQICLGTSGERFFYHRIRDSGEKSEKLIRYPYQSRVVKSCHQSNFFVAVTVKKTSWGGSKKFEDIASEKIKTFSVSNSRIYNLDKIFVTEQEYPVKLDRTRKV